MSKIKANQIENLTGTLLTVSDIATKSVDIASKVSSSSLSAGSGASLVGYTPTGLLTATTVEDALNEVRDASKVSYTPDGTGAVATNVQNKLMESVSVLDFGAIGDGVTDDTAALTLAQASADYIEVLEGMNCKVSAGLNSWQFFGSGGVFEPGRQWQLSRAPQTDNTQKVYRGTFGTYETAAGSSVVINRGSGQDQSATEVEGATTQGIAGYQGFDHVAQFAAAYSFASQQYSGTSTTYTATSVSQAGLSAYTVDIGVLIRTNHAPWFVGKVMSKSGDTITVDAWYTQSTGIAATPANDIGGVINPNTKIWVNNSNLHLTATGLAESGTGFELGLLIDKAGAGANTVGFDVIGLSGEDAQAHYISRGNTTDGFKSSNATQASFHANQDKTLGGDREGFRSETSKIGHRSINDAVGVRVENPTSSAMDVVIAGSRKFGVGIDGLIDGLYLNTVIAGNGATLASTCAMCIATGAVVYLTASGAGSNPGKTVIITNKSGGVLTVGGNGHTIDGAASIAVQIDKGAVLVSDGGNWVIALQT